MELPRARALETEGRKATHDFLSLYSSSSQAQQDPTPPQGGYLETHDFLRPLERVGKNSAKEEDKVEMSAEDKLPPLAAEHLLPGGIGTYSISYVNNQRGLKPEGEGSLFTVKPIGATGNDENSNSSSYTGSGFTLWDESAVQKGKTGKENFSAQRHVLQEAGVNMVGEQWMPALERPSQSSSYNKHKTSNFSSLSSSQLASLQKNHSFLTMIKSAKNDQEECDDDDDDDKEFITKKASSSQPQAGYLPIKTEAKTIDQKPNTPRSKHSATEQRRRSKINDRFQNLREIVPNSDQKRDKASFLLEVIEYIQFLQEKVNKYESSYNVWSHEPSKITQRRNCHMGEGVMDHSQGANTGLCPASVLGLRFDEKKIQATPPIPMNGQNLVESDTSTATTFKEKVQQPAAPIHPPIQANIFSLGRSSTVASPLSPKQTSDTNKTTPWVPSHVLPNRSCTDYWTRDKLKDQNLAIESGTISISNVYSQRLLSTLTLALQESGIDLSRATISVQIDLGKSSNAANSSTSTVKQDDVPRDASRGDEFGQALKRFKTI